MRNYQLLKAIHFIANSEPNAFNQKVEKFLSEKLK